MAFPSSVTGFARATFPIPFVPSGHFPLTRGIGPLEGGRLCPFECNGPQPFGVPLICPFGGTFPQGKATVHPAFSWAWSWSPTWLTRMMEAGLPPFWLLCLASS